MPTLKVANSKTKRFAAVDPDEIWADGHAWYPNELGQIGYPEIPTTLTAYDSNPYSFKLDDRYQLLWVTLADTLQRSRRSYFILGPIKFLFFLLMFWINRSLSRRTRAA
jgi:hypothetical protein